MRAIGAPEPAIEWAQGLSDQALRDHLTAECHEAIRRVEGRAPTWAEVPVVRDAICVRCGQPFQWGASSEAAVPLTNCGERTCATETVRAGRGAQDLLRTCIACGEALPSRDPRVLYCDAGCRGDRAAEEAWSLAKDAMEPPASLAGGPPDDEPVAEEDWGFADHGACLGWFDPYLDETADPDDSNDAA